MMKEIDAGHDYELDVLDGDGTTRLTFVKREGDGYPLNVGHYSGTNCQEVIRALISRVKYMDRQIRCSENQIIINSLRNALIAFETRAARRHGRELHINRSDVESLRTCKTCGHIGCNGH